MKKLYVIVISLLLVGSVFGIASILGAQYTSFGANNYRVYDANYNWIEIKDTGTEISGWLAMPCWSSDTYDYDDGYIELEPGFSFPFYGSHYDKFYLSTNGHIDFTQGCGNVLNNWHYGLKIPQPSEADYYDDGNDWAENPFIGFFFCDLDFNYNYGDGYGHAYYQNFGDYFVIEFDEVPMYWDDEGSYNSDAGTHTMQVILYKNGNIKMQYKSLTYTKDYNGHTAVVGLDLDAITGVSYDGAIRNDMALLYVYSPRSIPVTKILEILKKNQED
jgi:hypothetical protein